jgi:hypothetical protein
MKLKRLFSIPILAVGLCLTTTTSCMKTATTGTPVPPSTSTGLQKAAKTIESVANINDGLVMTILAENKAGVIPDDVTRVLLNEVCGRITKVVTLTADLTAQYTKFPADAQPKIATLLQPIVDAVKQALDTGLTGIKNPMTLARIQTVLLSIQESLLLAQNALGGA